MKRSPEMQKLVDHMSKDWFGRTGSEVEKNQTCLTCGGPATHFKDNLSRKEYSISHMCQDCQDGVFDCEE